MRNCLFRLLAGQLIRPSQGFEERDPLWEVFQSIMEDGSSAYACA
jgi:hypothetical protein